MKRTWKEINWLWVAGAFSATYVAAVAFTFGSERIWNFLSTATALNEVGDFLAGVFAPVALIWLVAAVLTQRQELNETRDQFAENQKVVDAQLKTINNQNALLVLQHNQAIENAKQAYRLSLFDKRFQIYEKFVKFDADHNGTDYSDASYWAMTNLAQEAAFVFDRSIEEWLENIAQQIFDYTHFKSANPLRIQFDGNGNSQVLDDEHNSDLRKEYTGYTGWISEQFLPEVRIEKFWRFMNVSDQPYVDG